MKFKNRTPLKKFGGGGYKPNKFKTSVLFENLYTNCVVLNSEHT